MGSEPDPDTWENLVSIWRYPEDFLSKEKNTMIKVYEFIDKVIGLTIETQAVPPKLRMLIRITWLKIEINFGVSETLGS